MTIIAIVIALYVLFSAAIVVSVCMISSRFSQQQGLVEEWDYEEAPARTKPEMGKVTRYA